MITFLEVIVSMKWLLFSISRKIWIGFKWLDVSFSGMLLASTILVFTAVDPQICAECFQNRQIVKHGREPRVNRNKKLLCWRGPAVI
jgi:hypothetical protein